MSEEDEIDDEDDGTPSAVDPAAHRKARVTAASRKREAEGFWRSVLGAEVGRRELWGLLSNLHTFDTRFACGPNGFPQPEATWFHAGEQSAGLRLYQAWIRLDQSLVALMHQENDPNFAQPSRRKRKEAD